MKEKSMNNKPVITQKYPYPIEVKEGKSYYWCQCGQSRKQPFCDGSHKGMPFNSAIYKATETKKSISVDANLPPINHFVMARTIAYK